MLEGMRNAAKNWLGKIVLTVLFSFLIVSFAIWGIGDIFRGFGAGTVARAGNVDIPTEEFRNEYQTALQNLQTQSRQPITSVQARALGLDRQVLGRMISDALLDQRTRQLGLARSNEDFAASVMKDPAFFGPTGSFDRTVFQDVLRRNGLTEARFTEKQRALYLRQELTGALTSGVKLPQTMLEMLHRYTSETRSVEFFTLPAPPDSEIAAPSDKDIETFFETRKTLYRAPEYRRIITLSVHPAGVADPSKVSEADVRAEYEKVKGQRFTTAEQREVQQIVFKSGEEQAAREALEKIRAGAKFQAVAEERKLTERDISLGLVPREKILDPEVAKTAFSIKAGETGDVVAGRFGPVLVHVVKIEPLAVKPLEEVSEQLRKDIAARLATEAVQKLHERIEDQRTSGKPLEEAAKVAGLHVRVIESIDAQGRDNKGQPVQDLQDREILLRAAFASDIGVDNETISTPDRSYVWFEVANVEQARERRLEEVREEITKAWREDQIAQKLRDKAQELVKKIEGGASMEDVAKEAGAKVEHLPDVKRTGHEKLALSIVERIYSVHSGKAESATGTAGARVIFKVLDSNIPPFNGDDPGLKAVAAQFERSFSEDIAVQYLAKLQADAGITINQTIMRNVVGGETN